MKNIKGFETITELELLKFARTELYKKLLNAEEYANKGSQLALDTAKKYDDQIDEIEQRIIKLEKSV